MKYPSTCLCLLLAAPLFAAMTEPAKASKTEAAASNPPSSEIEESVAIVLHTSNGPIEATLFAKETPVTVANFLLLADRGFFDGLQFHRVIPNFMIQGGDPTATGRGGPGYVFEDEIRPNLRHNKPGILSMANAGPRTNGSQFFITHVATPWLDGRHTVFGEVTKGQSVVDSIRQGATIERIEILDTFSGLFKAQAERIAEWNATLEPKPKAIAKPEAEADSAPETTQR